MKVSGYVMSGNPEKYGKRLKQGDWDWCAWSPGVHELHLFSNDSSDDRLESPQEIAFSEKQRLKVLDEMTALHESEYHEFPAHALRDMTDKTFASLLGMNQFVGGVE